MKQQPLPEPKTKAYKKALFEARQRAERKNDMMPKIRLAIALFVALLLILNF